MANYFIQYRPYKDLSLIESCLMSLIVGFSKTGLDICFSNQYAAKLFNTSERTISRTITDLIDKKYITYYKTQTRRILYLKKEPEILNLEISLCDIDNSSTQDRHNDYTGIDKSVNSIDKSSTPSGTFVHTRIDNVSTNNIDNKIDNNIAVAAVVSGVVENNKSEFDRFQSYFPQGKNSITHNELMLWDTMSSRDKQICLQLTPFYVEFHMKNGKGNFIKNINKFLNEGFWNDLFQFQSRYLGGKFQLKEIPTEPSKKLNLSIDEIMTNFDEGVKEINRLQNLKR